MVLDKTVNDTVSILFSDFVYSIKGTDVSSQISNAKMQLWELSWMQ